MKLGFNTLYLCTEMIEFYEKYGFKYIGDGYHPGVVALEFMKISLT